MHLFETSGKRYLKIQNSRFNTNHQQIVRHLNGKVLGLGPYCLEKAYFVISQVSANDIPLLW